MDSYPTFDLGRETDDATHTHREEVYYLYLKAYYLYMYIVKREEQGSLLKKMQNDLKGQGKEAGSGLLLWLGGGVRGSCVPTGSCLV